MRRHEAVESVWIYLHAEIERGGGVAQGGYETVAVGVRARKLQLPVQLWQLSQRRQLAWLTGDVYFVGG